MTEEEFKLLWQSEKPLYEAWGGYVAHEITSKIKGSGKHIESFLKVPAAFRIKDDASLIDKAFHRQNKSYTNPYKEIEDKVGIRFVVLLLEDIDFIREIIANNTTWHSITCRHFDKDREKNPLLFTYQSVHHILTPKNAITYEGITIPKETPCEVQIRTLLQHAHAELTHDSIYKAKRTVKPDIHRTVAKSMALIETTDYFFAEVTKKLNYGPLEEHSIIQKLDILYKTFTGLEPITQPSALTVWDEFENFINENLTNHIESTLQKVPYLAETIRTRYNKSSFHQQSTILFIYWMMRTKKSTLIDNWPLQHELLNSIATDMGLSIDDD